MKAPVRCRHCSKVIAEIDTEQMTRSPTRNARRGNELSEQRNLHYQREEARSYCTEANSLWSKLFPSDKPLGLQPDEVRLSNDDFIHLLDELRTYPDVVDGAFWTLRKSSEVRAALVHRPEELGWLPDRVPLDPSRSPVTIFYCSCRQPRQRAKGNPAHMTDPSMVMATVDVIRVAKAQGKIEMSKVRTWGEYVEATGWTSKGHAWR